MTHLVGSLDLCSQVLWISPADRGPEMATGELLPGDRRSAGCTVAQLYTMRLLHQESSQLGDRLPMSLCIRV